MSYTTTSQIRLVTGLTESQIGDSALKEMILQATAIVNTYITVPVRNEEVEYIDQVRKNDIHDGETTKFYPQNTISNYLSDITNDGEVTTDDITVYKIDNEDNKTELTVSSIDVDEGSFTLSEAPGTDTRKLLVDYGYSFYNVDTPDKLVELLTTYLTASYSYLYKDHDLPSSTSFGNIKISRSQVGMAYNRYTDRFQDLLRQVIIPCNKPRVGTYKEMI